MSESQHAAGSTAPAQPAEITGTRVAVIGAGTMGRGIAQLAAQHGCRVRLYDPFPDALERAERGLADLFALLHDKGRLAEHPGRVLRRIAFTDELQDLGDADVVIEAAPEELELKRKLFAHLDGIVAPEAILASNTSTLSITRIAAATSRPERVVGLHFFNPAPLMRLAEVVPGLNTAQATVDRASALARSLGKTPVTTRDRPGFIVNRVSRPFYGEALKLAGEGLPIAVADRIVRGLGFPMGPFELLDLIGLDVNLASSRSIYEAFFHEPRYRPHPLQQVMVDAGRLGRKSGRGFYRYPGGIPAGTHAAATPETPEETPPRVLVVGDTPVARMLRERFPTVARPTEAELVIDARVSLREKTHIRLADELPIATLTWAHSASAALRHYPGQVAGFSLVPPLEEHAVTEIYPPLSGDGDALRLTRAFFTGHGLETRVLPDQPGGVGFRIVVMLINEAASAVAEGLASAADIDTAMSLGTNYPRGPLQWGLLLGFETVLRALEGLHAELGEDRYRPHPLLRRLAAVGAEAWP